jgi:hypothetical protein
MLLVIKLTVFKHVAKYLFAQSAKGMFFTRHAKTNKEIWFTEGEVTNTGFLGAGKMFHDAPKQTWCKYEGQF